MAEYVMKTKKQSIVSVTILILVIAVLACCASKNTQKAVNDISCEKYEQVALTMTTKDVVKIMGRKQNSITPTSEGTLGATDRYSWKNSDGSSANITFLDERVIKKTQSNLCETENTTNTTN
jgi:hypothetical protein